MKSSRRQRSENRKRRAQRLAEPRSWSHQSRPMIKAKGIAYEVADRARGMVAGGIGLMLQLARRVGLVEEIDRSLQLLKLHLPYHESDHVLNIAFNVLAGGHCLEDIERLRQDEVYLAALGAERIPDPTTAGDFCRRFSGSDVESLMEAINRCRLRVWQEQPREFFREAIIDADGTLAPTHGKCKEGADFAYNGIFGYHPLLISLANTQEPLFLMNRSGNRPSHEGAAGYFDRAIDLCRKAGFRRVLLRGDTDYSQTQHLDRWDEGGVRFLFGMPNSQALFKKLTEIPDENWRALQRPPKYGRKTKPRSRPRRAKDEVVKRRRFRTKRTEAELVASFAYQPVACSKPYRVVVLTKNLSWLRGEEMLCDDLMHFFFITNDWKTPATELVRLANGRCDQENINAQLKSGGVRAMQMPLGDLESNWAYMVMVSLAWTLKAWFALLLPTRGRWREQHGAEQHAVLRMEFRSFLLNFMLVPVQIVQSGRKLIYRLLAWNPWQSVLLRAATALRC